MSISYLMDENLSPLYKRQLLKGNPNLRVFAVGDPGTPPKGTLDPEILRWCEENDCILITNNRKSMPNHLRDHLAEERHIPGIITLNESRSIGETIEELLLIAGAGIPEDYRDRITYLSDI
ncbi:MAG TPA: hypothetical protein DHW02_16045 [Ktedonobacter sp.]|nr:hypothetical protein [Ktedonobacter sp.]